MSPIAPSRLEPWLEALEQRHFASLTFREVRKGLQALSRVYVAKRERLASGGALDGAGKKAAFALYYGPMHLLTVGGIVEALQTPPPIRIIDLGCGTGVGGAAWALARGSDASVDGVDLDRWAISEANRTYRDLGLRGRARTGNLLRAPLRASPGLSIIAAYAANELDDTARDRLFTRLIAAWRQGAQVLIVEPIGRSPIPWWDAQAEHIRRLGGRIDEWDLSWAPPALLQRLEKAAGLTHRSLKARTFFLPG